MMKPLVSRKERPGRPDQELLDGSGRDDEAQQRLGPGHHVVVEDRVLEEVDQGLGAEDAHEEVGDREHQQEDGDSLDRIGGPGAQAAGEGAARRGAPLGDHLVVEPVGRGQALPGDHEAERLGVPGGQASPDPLHALPPLPGDPGGQPGLEGVVPGEQHEPERAPGEPSLGKERLELGQRRLDGLVVAGPELRDAGLGDPLEQERQAGPLHRHRGDDVDPQRGGEPVGVDAEAARGGLVGHVEREREGDAGLGELAGEEQPPPEVLGVADLKADVLRLAEQDVPRHLLVLRHGEQVVGARRVEHVPALAADLGRAPGDLDGGAGVVRDGDVLAGQRAEEDALAHVGIAHQHERAGRGHDLLVIERLGAGGRGGLRGHGRASFVPASPRRQRSQRP